MKTDEKAFADYIQSISLDDAPGPEHRRRLEAALLQRHAATAKARPRPFPLKWGLTAAATALLAATACIVYLGHRHAPGAPAGEVVQVRPAVGDGSLDRQVINGPVVHRFDDGSVAEVEAVGTIRPYLTADTRGFELLKGKVSVTVAKGERPFVVKAPLGVVTALGTRFEIDMVDGRLEGGGEAVKLLAVKVAEGRVEVSNAQGATIIGAGGEATVTEERAPYDFTQDSSLPAGLTDRIRAMKEAFAAGDAAAWAANFNMKALLALARGEISKPNEHPWFGAMASGDVANLQANLARVADQVESPDQLRELFEQTVNITACDIYIGSVELDEGGKSATAVCTRRSSVAIVRHTPGWAFFDGGWWQIDD